jgi:hypothetical protein
MTEVQLQQCDVAEVRGNRTFYARDKSHLVAVMLHICLVDNIQIILSVGKLYCHITVTDMLLGQIPICCRYVTDICHITVTDICHITVTDVCHITVTDMLWGQIPICCRYVTDTFVHIFCRYFTEL